MACRQAIICTNAGIMLTRTLGTNFSEILSEIRAFSYKKMHLNMSSAKWRLFCLGLNDCTLSQGSNSWRETRCHPLVRPGFEPGLLNHSVSSRLNACWQTDWALKNKVKKTWACQILYTSGWVTNYLLRIGYHTDYFYLVFHLINTITQGQHGHHFENDHLIYICIRENV